MEGCPEMSRACRHEVFDRRSRSEGDVDDVISGFSRPRRRKTTTTTTVSADL
jgi:hypothetical protein